MPDATPYATTALEPHIEARTMEIHHSKCQSLCQQSQHSSGHALRQAVGLAIVLLGASVLLWQCGLWVMGQPALLRALAGGSMAALATGLGALAVLLPQRMAARWHDSLMGLGAGVVLAACVFSLMQPALSAALSLYPGSNSRWPAAGMVGLALLLGAGSMMLMVRMVQRQHCIKGREGMDAGRALRRAGLFVFAITLHNLPEGLAIGVGYAANEGVRANALATGIALQDVAEGMVVVALLAAGCSRAWSVAVAMATGLIEPAGAVLGAAAIGYASGLLPWGLGFAAGAMLFVISHQIIPEPHLRGHGRYRPGGLVLGFVLMTMLDTALG